MRYRDSDRFVALIMIAMIMTASFFGTLIAGLLLRWLF